VQSADIEYAAKNYAEAARLYGSVLKESPKNFDAQISLARSQRELDQHGAAAESFIAAAGVTSDARWAASAFYSAAGEYARVNRKDDAFAMLTKAFAAGYPNRDAVNTDPLFAGLKDDPRLKEIVAAR
jgi:tetratricopeptide (TPR) repeat protein